MDQMVSSITCESLSSFSKTPLSPRTPAAYLWWLLNTTDDDIYNICEIT